MTTASHTAAADQPRQGAWLTASALVAALASVLVLTLAGCASPAGIAPRSAPLAPEVVGLGATTSPAEVEPTTADLAVPEAWWTGFGDPSLDALVARALADSPSLRVAQARLDRAGAGVAGADAARGLHGDVSLEASRQRYTRNGMVPAPIAGTVRTTGTLQAGVGYEFDPFGRQRAALDAAVGSERAARADMAAARLLLADLVTRQYLHLARLLAQREVATRALAQRDQVLALVQQRVGAGLDTQVELRQGEGALPEARQQIEALDEQVALARHALAALTVQPPTALDGLAPALSQLRPVPLPASLPADLLARRPDIVAARWRVEAASHAVREAKAGFYPNVNLAAFAGLSSIGLDRLLRSGSQQYGVTPALHLPLFSQAALRADLRGRTADVDAAVEDYNGAVVDAVHEVADQLSTLRSIARQQADQQQAGAAAEAAYGLATQRYRAGLGTYLVVLNAESTVLQQRRLAADLRARALDAQAALARAVGGGYHAAL